MKMATLIKTDGTEQTVQPLKSGFTLAEVSQLVGSRDLRLIPLNSQILLIVPDRPRPGPHNLKAAHILKFVLLEEDYQVDGHALFISSEEFRPLIRELKISQTQDDELSVSSCQANRRSLRHRLNGGTY
jgi:hypothetical protein